MVKVLTSLTVVSSCVVFADTSTMDHSGMGEDVSSAAHRSALRGVSVTEAAASHHHVVQGVVIFVLRVSAFAAEKGVPEGKEASEVYS